MSKKPTHVSATPATDFLRAHGVAFTEHVYDYVDKGGTACKVPFAPEYIRKVQERGSIGKKRKTVKC